MRITVRGVSHFVESIITALLADGNLWQIVIAIIVVVAGSSAVSAWITGGFAAKRESKAFRREVRAKALEAIGDAYSNYMSYGNASNPPVLDEKRDQKIATASSIMQARVAAIGDTSLLTVASKLVIEGESFASQNEETRYSDVESTFISLITKIATTVPEK